MRSISNSRRLAAFSAVVLLIVTVPAVIAQKPGGGGGTPSGPSGVGSSSSRNNGSVPGNGVPGSPTSPDFNRPMFLSGRVMFDDGSQANPDIRIERVCGGARYLEAHTDSKGHFSFQLGQNAAFGMDAEDTMIGGTLGASGRQAPAQMNSSGGAVNRTNSLWNCELAAAYPGYRSDVVELSTRRSLDNPDVGTIILHRLMNVTGSTLSVTTALAPKNAQKEYQKGLQTASKGNFEEAEKRFLKATDEYPKYAVAWFALGETQQRLGKPDLARKSYAAAIAADSKYVSPYNQLALISVQEGKWQDAADYSKQVIQLNPVEFPQAFWFNAIANYNLKKPDEAAKSAQQLVKLDTEHKYAEAEGLLGQLQLDKRNYAEAATHLRAYLALRPNAPNAEAVKQVLAKIDQANSEAKKEQPQ